MNKAVFLDRDGVINRKLENDYVKSWAEFQFLPGVIEAIKALSQLPLLNHRKPKASVGVCRFRRGLSGRHTQGKN